MSSPYYPPPDYNSNTTGGTLQGIASIIGALSVLRDPDAQRRNALYQNLLANPQLRDQLAAQYQDNPEALDAILGRRPRFGSTTRYDATRALITGPLSPEAQARRDIAKAQSADANRKRTIDEGVTPSLQRGAAMDNFIQTGAGGVEQPAPNVPGDAEAGILDIPVVKGPTGTTEDLSRFEESLTNEGIRSPLQRRQELAATKLAEERAANSAQRVENERQQLQDLKDRAARKAQSQKISDEAIANVTKQGYKNLYVAQQEGKLSPNQVSAILDTDKGNAQYKNDQDAYFRQQQLNIEQDKANQLKEQTKNSKFENAALWIFKGANGKIGYDQAQDAARDPQKYLNSDAPEDQPVKEALQEIHDRQFKDTRNAVLRARMVWQSGLKGRKNITDQDVVDLNDLMDKAVSGVPGFTAPHYTRVEKPGTGMFGTNMWNKYGIAPDAGSPELFGPGEKIQKSPEQQKADIDLSKDPGAARVAQQGEAPAKDFAGRALQLQKSGLSKDKIIEQLKKEGWDVGTGKKLGAK